MRYVASFKHRVDIKSEDEYFNPCCIGGDVFVDVVGPILVENDFVIDMAHEEDWGWFIWFKDNTYGYAFDVILVDEAQWEYEIILSDKIPFWKRLLYINKKSRLTELCRLVDQSLKEFGVGSISWWLSDEKGVKLEEYIID